MPEKENDKAVVNDHAESFDNRIIDVETGNVFQHDFLNRNLIQLLKLDPFKSENAVHNHICPDQTVQTVRSDYEQHFRT